MNPPGLFDWMRPLRSPPDDAGREVLPACMEPARMEIDGQQLPIALIRHARARRMILRLAADGSEVRVTLPARASAREAIAFARSREQWLRSQLARIPARRAVEPGAVIAYRGEEYRLEWDLAAPRKPRLEEQAAGKGHPAHIVMGGPREGLERRLQRWLEQVARALIESDAADYCAAAGIKVPALALSRARHRWGSCSASGCIRINWRLVQAPDWVRRSVVAHEVAHLVHFDHSRSFYALLDSIYEHERQAADRWLKQHGRSLYSTFG